MKKIENKINNILFNAESILNQIYNVQNLYESIYYHNTGVKIYLELSTRDHSLVTSYLMRELIKMGEVFVTIQNKDLIYELKV